MRIRWFALLALVSLATTLSVRAANDLWTGSGIDNNWMTAGNWSPALTPSAGDSLFFGGSLQLNNNNNFATDTSFAGLTFNAGAGAFVLNGNEIITTASIADQSLSLETINLPIVLGNASHSLNVGLAGSLVINGVMSDGGLGYGITTTGEGLVTLTPTNTYTGATTVNAGELLLDFSNNEGSTNIISGSSPLSMGGGTLQVNGNASVASSQTFNGTTFAAGANVINVAPVSGSTVPTLALGALTYDAGASIVFNGPSYANAATTSTGQPGAFGNTSGGTPVPATANITTTSGAANVALQGGVNGVAEGSNVGLNAAFATVGLYDYAIVINSSPFTVIGASQGTVQSGDATAALTGGGSSNGSDGAYTLIVNGQLGGSSGGAGGPYDIVGTAAGRNTDSLIALRFNAPGTGGYDGGYTGGGAVSFGAVLVTPNVGANDVVMASMAGGLRSTSPCSLVVFQNNVSGYLTSGGVFNGRTAGMGYTQSGAGTVYNTSANPGGYTGPTFLNGGTTMIIADAGLGNPTNAATVTLNGGTILGNATFTMDNSGAHPRPLVLGNNGGGLAAANNDTMTVDGVVSNANSGTGPLTIGIPASSANGNTAGLLAGSNMGTNTTVMAIGTVALTGSNIYTAGTIVLGGGKLSINGINALGSANFGGLTLNSGTLQYAAGFSGNGSGDLTSIGTAGITLAAGGGTIDANGNTVTYAGSIGNGGSGALTVASTALGGVLNLNGADTYTGGTTVNGGTLNANNTSGSATGSGNVSVASGATLGGTGTISGNVNWQAGSFASFTSGSPLTVGVVTLNNNAITVNVPGVTPLGVGSYTLMHYTTAGSTGSFDTGSPTYTGAGVAPGTISSVSTGGGVVTLTVVAGGVSATWTNSASGNWSVGANWSSNPNVPHAAGDSATLGAGSALQTITLDASETVGGIDITNPNSFVIANAGNTLTLDNKGTGATIGVTAGTANAINTSLALNDNVDATVAVGNSLAISGSIANVNNASPKTLAVDGAGTTVLAAANSYGPSAGSTGTTLSGGGTLQVANNSALGAGDLSVGSVPGGTLQASASGLALNNNIDIVTTFTVDNHGNNLTLNGTIGGGGPLTEIGTGTLTLTGNNTNAGNVNINAGVLSISSSANVADVPNIVLNGGDLLGNGATLGNNIGIGAATTTGMIDASGTLTLNGVIGTDGSSANNLAVNSVGGSGMVVLGNANTFNGTTTIGAGSLQLGNALALQNSTLNYSGGGTLDFGTLAAATVGGLSGSKNLPLLNDSSAAVTLTVGGNGASTLYSGDLSDGGAGAALVFGGSGTLDLTGTNIYTGNTTSGGGGSLEISTGGVINCAALAGSGFVVAGGTVTLSGATTTLGTAANDFLETAGSVTAQAFNGPGNDGALFKIMGGHFSASSVSMARTVGITAGPTATTPINAPTTSGFYVDSTNLADPAIVDLGSIAFGNANSSGSMRVEGNATVVVTNEVEVGAITAGSTRWSVLQVNGGSFTSLDTVNGIVISQNGAAAADNAEVYLSGGTTTANIINFGLATDTAGGQGFLIVNTNASLYLGAGGIVQANTVGYSSTISLLGGLLGATADWSSLLPMQLNANGTNFTIQAADASGVAHDIVLSGAISSSLTSSGALVKTGNGTLVLNGANSYNGLTTISNGVLFISTSHSGGGDFTVNDGTTLGVSNTMGGSSAAVGVLTLGSSSGPTTLILTNVASTTTALIAASGGVTLNGNCTVRIKDDANMTAPNEYPLIGYGPGIITNSGSFTLSVPAGVHATLTNDPTLGAVALLVSSITVVQPVLTEQRIPGGTLVLSGSLGTPGDPVNVLTSTNVATPLTNWTVLSTGNYDINGNFVYTNTGVLGSGTNRQFFILQGK